MRNRRKQAGLNVGWLGRKSGWVRDDDFFVAKVLWQKVFLGARPKLAQPAPRLVLGMTSWDRGSELSRSVMIPQVTVVAHLTRREDERSLKPDHAAGNCHARGSVHVWHTRLRTEKDSGVHSLGAKWGPPDVPLKSCGVTCWASWRGRNLGWAGLLLKGGRGGSSPLPRPPRAGPSC